MRRAWWIAAVALAVLGFGMSSADAGFTTYAAMGDSLSDEYADPIYNFNGGDRRWARNWLELVAQHRSADFGAYVNDPSVSPQRRKGYERNWAKDGSTTQNLLDDQQPQSVLAQNPDLAFVMVGGNDFRAILTEGADAQTTLQAAVVNTATVVQMLLMSDPDLRLVVANFPDVTVIPQARLAAMMNPSLVPLLQQLSGGIGQANGALAAQLGGLDRVAMVDISEFLTDAVNDGATINGEPMNTLMPGVRPQDMFVDYIHPGTVMQGRLANLFGAVAGERFGMGWDQFTDGELKQIAASVPSPEAFWLGGVGLVAVIVMVRRRK